MTSWLAEWTNSDDTVQVRLIDTPGPWNNFEFLDANAMLPNKGDFTNQTEHVVPTGGDWQMDDIDIDDTKVGAKGKGKVKLKSGTFPEGDFDWEIVKKI